MIEFVTGGPHATIFNFTLTALMSLLTLFSAIAGFVTIYHIFLFLKQTKNIFHIFWSWIIVGSLTIAICIMITSYVRCF